MLFNSVHAGVCGFLKSNNRKTIRVSNSLDPGDQDQHFVGPDLGPNSL